MQSLSHPPSSGTPYQVVPVVKNSPANARDTSSVRELERSPGEGNGNPLQYSWLEKSHGQRSLAGYSPWAPKSCTRLSTTKHQPFPIIFFFFQSLTTSDILCTLLIVFVYCLCSPLECKLHEGRNFYLIFCGLDKYIESMSE